MTNAPRVTPQDESLKDPKDGIVSFRLLNVVCQKMGEWPKKWDLLKMRFFAVENEVFRVNHRNPFFPAERADFHYKR